jgi:hypothetical protein
MRDPGVNSLIIMGGLGSLFSGEGATSGSALYCVYTCLAVCVCVQRLSNVSKTRFVSLFRKNGVRNLIIPLQSASLSQWI